MITKLYDLYRIPPQKQAALAQDAAGSFWAHAISTVLIFNALFARQLYRFDLEQLYIYVALAPIYFALRLAISLRPVRTQVGKIPFATEFRVKAALLIIALAIPHAIR